MKIEIVLYGIDRADVNYTFKTFEEFYSFLQGYFQALGTTINITERE